MSGLTNTTKRLNLMLSLVIILTIVAVLFPQPVTVQAAECAKTHTVVAGDNLSSIAVKYNTTVEAIAAANNLKAPYTIFIGQKLCIPGSSAPGGTGTGTGTTSTKPYFTVSFLGNQIIVKTVNYPKQNHYFVNATNVYTSLKYQLGWINQFKQTSVTKAFQLPNALRNIKRMRICLKNTLTDKVQCILSTRPTNTAN